MAIFDENDVQRVPCTTGTPSISVPFNGAGTRQIVIRDTDGVPVDLTTLCSDPDGSSSSSSAPSPQVKLAAQELYSSVNQVLNITGDVIDAENGLVSFEFTTDHTITVGMFIADVGVFCNGTLTFVYPVYVVIQPNAYYLTTAGGPLTIGEVRLALRDHCPESNYMLDALEFGDEEIAFCIRRCVDEWNETPPPVAYRTTQNFGYRHHWLLGVCGYLLRMAAHLYRRNHLSYSAAGVSIDDQNKFRDYDVKAQELLDEWRHFVKTKKVQINVENGYGLTASDYGWSSDRN